MQNWISWYVIALGVIGCGQGGAGDSPVATNRAAITAETGACGADGQIQPTQLIYLGPAEGEWGSSVPLAAQLTSGSGVALGGRELIFQLGAEQAVAMTDARGMALVQMAATQAPGDLALHVEYAGDAGHEPAQTEAIFVLHRVPTRLLLYAAPTLAVGLEQPVRATLTRVDGIPLAGKTVTFQVAGTETTAITDGMGMATATVIVPAGQGTGPATVSASFAGETGYAPAHAQTSILRFLATGLVVWGGNSPGLAPGQRVNVWGASWAAQVQGGDYAAGGEFKGWAQSARFELCQPAARTQGTPRLSPGCWAARGGQTSPPSIHAEYIGVLVTDAMAKSGGEVYGNVAALAVVKLDSAPHDDLTPGKPVHGTLAAIADGGTLFAAPPTVAATQTQPGAVAPGQGFDVLVELSNTSSAAAEGVMVQEALGGGTMPASAQQSVGRLAPAETRTIAFTATAPTVAVRSDSETSAAYQQRLAAQDGRLLASAGEVRFTDARGGAMPIVPLYSAGRLALPRLVAGLAAPACVTPGESMSYTITVHNIGTGAAASGTATLLLPDGSQIELPIGALAAGASFQEHVPWSVPALPSREPGESAADHAARLQAMNGQALATTVEVIWHDAHGSLHGSITQEATSILHVELPPGSDLPPDPAEVATPLSQTSITPFADAVSFLYTGDEPIQVDVDPDALEARRLAVLRGKVSTREGTPLPGVTVTILAHPEYGKTLTREDGMFDMVVNGGGLVTVQYEMAGYLMSQRQVTAPWQDYAWLPEVVLIPLDERATAVDMSGASTEVQVAQGSPVTDADGTRQATLLFAPGTQASVVLPDGNTEALSTATVRATEYTVGETGPAAMPGELPATSGYTYAVELSVDEARALGAREVRFSQPVAFYVDNFLGFPAGTTVPVGYYDVVEGVWKAEENGKVVAIVGVASGLAQVDISGDGVPENEAALSAIGMTAAERQVLANLYAPGKSLWRASVQHFTTYDCNWPVGLPPDAAAPKLEPVRPGQPEDKPDCQSGSIIECQNQTLGESLPVAGTPFHLHYRSDRVPGRKTGRTLRIPLSNATLPGSVESIVVNFTVAGRRFSFVRPPQPNQMLEFTWDGKDAYGRTVEGQVAVVGSTGYTYRLVYVRPSERPRTFALLSSTLNILSPARDVGTLMQRWTTQLGTWTEAPEQLGGWRIDVHHAYDASRQALYPGNGGQHSVSPANYPVITHVASGPLSLLKEPQSIVAGPDGSLYLVAYDRIARIGPNGSFSFLAEAGSERAGGLAMGADGSLYFIGEGAVVRRISPDGIITTIAGRRFEFGYSGDDGPAVNAKLANPRAVAVGPDGSVYIADEHCVRRVGPDGYISTFAGKCLVYGDSGDNGPADQATLGSVFSIAVGPDGSVYISSSFRVRRVTPDGIITAFAGTGQTGSQGDHGPAVSARLTLPRGIAVAADGSVYIADPGSARIRHVAPDGIISTIAGTIGGNSGDNGPAAQASLSWPIDPAIAPDGSLYIADHGNWRVRRIGSALPGNISATHSLIASEDGNELYVFDASGRHLRTLDALTRAVRHELSYDSMGRLSTIRDAAGSITSVERDASGTPLAIIAPHGQRTALAVHASGHLSSITNPAGEETSFTYTAEGLLTSMTDARRGLHTYAYDMEGRLTRDTQPGGGFKALARTEQGTGYTVSLATALGRVTTYLTQNLSGNRQTRTRTTPDGLQTKTEINPDGSTIITAPDGTITMVREGPDIRFGMVAPLEASRMVKLPSGLTYSAEHTQTSTLMSGGSKLDIATLTDSVKVNNRIFNTTYTAATRKLEARTPLGRITTTTLDDKGRVTKVEVPGLFPVEYAYDSEGRLQSITQGSRTRSFTYNAQGYLATLTDPLGRILSKSYDAAGRVVSQTLPGNRTIELDYDAGGNLTALTPPGKLAHHLAYTPIDKTASYTPPPAHIGDPILSTTYGYDLDGDVTATDLPDGSSIEVVMDSAGRVDQVITPRTMVDWVFDSKGRLDALTDAAGASLDFSYDGPLVTRVDWTGGVQGSVEYTYTPDFTPEFIKVNGQSVKYIYDGDGLLKDAGALALARQANNGLLKGTTLASVTTSHTYNGYGEREAFSASVQSSPFYSLTLASEESGRIIGKTETAAGVTRIWGYGYDTAGRLETVTLNSAPYASYTYDSNGNRLSITQGGITLAATYDAQDRLETHGNATYTFGPNGDLQQVLRAGEAMPTEYIYDAQGALTEVHLSEGTRVEYVIDALGRRVGKSVNGTRVQGFLYDGNLRIVAELDDQNQVVARFVYATRVNVPDYMVKGGVTYRIITDQLGSVRLVVNAQDGGIAQAIEYGPWGEVLADSNPGFQPFGFAGGLYDIHTGLVRFGARDYDAETGRWTAKDPIGFAGGDANLYAYVGDSPVNRIDPGGLSWKAKVRAIVAAIEILKTGKSHIMREIQRQQEITQQIRKDTRGRNARKRTGTGAGDPPDDDSLGCVAPAPVPELDWDKLLDLNEDGWADLGDLADLLDPTPPLLIDPSQFLIRHGIGNDNPYGYSYQTL